MTADPAALSVTIVDGYVDEPAHFGVPPYISTYPRYVAGALVDGGAGREPGVRRDVRRYAEVCRLVDIAVDDGDRELRGVRSHTPF